MSATRPPSSTSSEPLYPDNQGCCGSSSAASITALVLSIIVIVGACAFLYFEFPDHRAWTILGGCATLLCVIGMFQCSPSNPFFDYHALPFVKAFMANYDLVEAGAEGHCLFFSVARGLIDLYDHADAAEKVAICAWIDGLKSAYGAIGARLDDMKLRLQQNGTGQSRADLTFVSALRHLVCSINEIRLDDASFDPPDGQGKAKHLKSMRETSAWGDEYEYTALASVGLKVTVLDTTLKRPQESDFLTLTKAQNASTPLLQKRGIVLYYTEGHYRYLRPKKWDSPVK
jgi:hypothetical protein